MRLEMRPATPERSENYLQIFGRNVLILAALASMALGPLLIVLMAMLDPGYLRPMFTSWLGVAILGGVVIFLGACVAMTLIAKGWMTKGRAWSAAGVVAVIAVMLLQFVTVWIVLLGPALLVVLKPSAQ